MREKELRLALVCYGGVSLAVYMHGITKEVWKLLRASSARVAPAAAAPADDDSASVYRDLLDSLAPQLDLRVMCDIVAGASAGGINGILLAHAISGGHDMEPLRDLWLNGADVDRLLDADNASTRFSKWWAMPLIWYARRRGIGAMADVAEPAARREVAAKLSRLMRSKWFRPPFSGHAFSAMLFDALGAMQRPQPSPALIPPGQPLDLFVTVTDYHGAPERLRLHSPSAITETEHRLIIAFRDGGPAEGEGAGYGALRHLAHPAELAFAARATASFPGAFPPARVGEIDGMLRARNVKWPGRAAFLDRVFAARRAAGLSPETATLIDGSVLNNRPFAPAIEALGQRPAHREVDRRFVYIDPKPGRHAAAALPAGGLPGFFATILRSLADIPREQPIRDNLEAIEARSGRVRRLRYVLDGMQPQVDATIASAIGARFFLARLTPERLSDWRNRIQGEAAKQAGFAYGAYGQLKLSQVVEELAASLVTAGGLAMSDGAARLRGGIWQAVRDGGIDRVADAAGRGGSTSPYVGFLRDHDLGFRIRRMRFLVRRLNGLAVAAVRPEERRAIEMLKSGLYQQLAPYLERRRPGFFDARVRDPALACAEGGCAVTAMAAHAEAMDLQALDAATDSRLVALIGALPSRDIRRASLRAWLGFPFYDIAMLPLLQGDGLDEFDEIKVDRISPDDAVAIRSGGAAATLKGTQFNAFGAFFSRAYRENDYLWGRLHAADRLIDIIASTLPADMPLPPATLALHKAKAFRAILKAERPFLTAIPELFAALEREIGPGAA